MKMSDTSGRPCCLTRCAPLQACCWLLRWPRPERRLTLPAITSWPSGAKVVGVLKRGMMQPPPGFWLLRLAGVAGPWVLLEESGGAWGWHEVIEVPSPIRIKGHRWERVRRQILDAAGWRCESCGKAGAMEVHHVKPLHLAAHPMTPITSRFFAALTT